VLSATVVGIEASPIHVEVDVAQGLPGCHIVGLPDAGVKEGRVRIRGAIENSGLKYPLRRITVNLAPADLRKDGAAFDVPIAVGILSAAGILPPEVNDNSLFVGELALDGTVRSVRGVLPMAAYARAQSIPRLFVPRENAAEAAIVGGDCAIVPVGHLAELVDALRGEMLAAPRATCPPFVPSTGADLSEVRGQEVARRALEIAAAGGHNIVFVGPPGSGLPGDIGHVFALVGAFPQIASRWPTESGAPFACSRIASSFMHSVTIRRLGPSTRTRRSWRWRSFSTKIRRRAAGASGSALSFAR
jgi:magnesium chelatase family protein